MDVLRNGEVIGYSNYFFEHKDNNMKVKNYTKFKVNIFGATIFSISSEQLSGLIFPRHPVIGCLDTVHSKSKGHLTSKVF